jgi:3',5'-cyclic AMP phosphodiesterase CpdA
MKHFRFFLRFLAASLFLNLGCGHAQTAQPDTLRFSLITDTHISKPGSDTGLATIVADIDRNPQLAFVVVTGDMSDFGTITQLRQAKKLLDRLDKSYYCLPGNHDTG